MNYSELTEVKPYPAYKTSQIPRIGEIPEHWEVSHLRYFCECLDGRRIPLSADNRGARQGNIPYWGANSVIDHINEWIFDEPLVLVGEDGAPFNDPTRSVAFFINEKVWVNNHIHVLRCRKELRPEFLVHILNSVDYNNFISGSTRDKLTQQRLLDIPVQLAPATEQAAIVRFLDHADEQIRRYVAAKERLIALLEEQRQALVHQAVTRGLDPSVRLKPSGVEWLRHIPEDWELSRVKNEFQSLNHLRVPLSTTERGAMNAQVYSYYGASGIIDKVESYLFDDDLLLLAEDGANLVLRNLPLAIIARGKFWVNNHAHVLKPKKGNLEFLAAVMEGINYLPWISGLWKALTTCHGSLAPCSPPRRAAQPKLTLERLLSIPIAVPTPAGQNDIIDKVRATTHPKTTAIEQARRQINLMNEYRTRLIADVVTGQLDVREAAAQLPAAPLENKLLDEIVTAQEVSGR